MRGKYKNVSKGPMLPTIQNVVSFAELEMEFDIDLSGLAQKVEGARLNKKRFPAVIMRRTQPKSTILCFKSGRLIIIGSQSETDAETSAKLARKGIEKVLNINIPIKAFRVTNIVANADLGFTIHISKLSMERNIMKNDNFPGVVYKNLPDVKSVLIFASGKVVFTGAKSKDDIDRAYVVLKERMMNFRGVEQKAGEVEKKGRKRQWVKKEGDIDQFREQEE